MNKCLEIFWVADFQLAEIVKLVLEIEYHVLLVYIPNTSTPGSIGKNFCQIVPEKHTEDHMDVTRPSLLAVT